MLLPVAFFPGKIQKALPLLAFCKCKHTPLLVKCKYFFMKKSDEELCRRSACAISMALEAIGDKWSLLILRDLMFTGKRSYGELQSSEEKIATNILASRLQEELLLPLIAGTLTKVKTMPCGRFMQKAPTA